MANTEQVSKKENELGKKIIIIRGHFWPSFPVCQHEVKAHRHLKNNVQRPGGGKERNKDSKRSASGLRPI